jgi:predicted transcriptional regulator
MSLKELFKFSNNEKKLFDLFIEKGTLSTGDITKYLSIARPNIYDLLNKLIEKNLITRIKNNNRVQYSINHLDYEEILAKKKEEIDNLEKNIIELNQNIENLKNKSETHIEIFSGNDGLYKFVNQSFDTEKITTYGAEGILEKDYPHIWNIWVRKLKEKKIPLLVIYNKKFKQYREKNKIDVIQEKFIERDFTTNVMTQIFDNQVNIFHWQKIPTVIVIKNKEIAKAYREEFNLMWSKTK